MRIGKNDVRDRLPVDINFLAVLVTTGDMGSPALDHGITQLWVCLVERFGRGIGVPYARTQLCEHASHETFAGRHSTGQPHNQGGDDPTEWPVDLA